MIATSKNPTSEKGTYPQTLSLGGLTNQSEEFSEHWTIMLQIHYLPVANTSTRAENRQSSL